jgi:uncharacterized protein YycO
MAVMRMLPAFFLFSVFSCGHQQENTFKKNSVRSNSESNNNHASIETGDIIFQTSQSGQSRAISLATHSKYTHCGIIFIEGADTLVLEAVQPVKRTPLHEWINRGDNHSFVVKRIKQKVLSKEMINNMKHEAENYTGKDYDLHFSWSDEKLYCSELVWKIYKRVLGVEIGSLQKLKEFDLTNPVVKQKLKERYGNNIPMEEQVISPAAIFDSDLLETVMEK